MCLIRKRPQLPISPDSAPACRQSIRFENVGLNVDGHWLVEDLNFTIPGGRFTAIIGQSGAGKTTIFHLLLRLMRPTTGTITINDVPIDALDDITLRNLIGFIPQNPFIFNQSLRENLANSLMLFHVLKRMVTREVPLRSVSGPIGIAQVARNALSESPRHFIWLLGFFSLQLGILNLLPIPVLDGGHILILLIESVTRRDLSEKLKERVMQAGFVFLLAFMGVIIYLDIMKTLGT